MSNKKDSSKVHPLKLGLKQEPSIATPIMSCCLVFEQILNVVNLLLLKSLYATSQMHCKESCVSTGAIWLKRGLILP